LGIPQEEHRELNTQTASQFTFAQTIVGLPRIVQRGPLPDQQDVLREMRTACQRKPRLEPVSPVEAEALLKTSEILPRAFGESIPQWVRLFCHFPESGLAFIKAYLHSLEYGRLSPKLKAEIAWLASRHDRALYALGYNTRRLRRLGYSLDQVFALSQLESQPANLKAAFSLVEKLTATPQSVTDADIHAVRLHYSPEETAEIVFHTAQAAFFNRCTEAMNLPVEDLP
jgi:alkylhydroperoxidase family enzyme